MAVSERDIIASELRWTFVVAGVIGVIMVCILGAGLIMHINPPSNVETVDPARLHLTGEFTEGNLGTSVSADGEITARMVTAQFAFTPQCVVLPRDRPVTLRFASPDVIHGILITGTNVNTMVVPGYVSQVRTVLRQTGDLLMPCHEYCGLGHSQMWATIRVVPESEFRPGPDGKVACDQR